jgi:hypothetical protein
MCTPLLPCMLASLLIDFDSQSTGIRAQQLDHPCPRDIPLAQGVRTDHACCSEIVKHTFFEQCAHAQDGDATRCAWCVRAALDLPAQESPGCRPTAVWSLRCAAVCRDADLRCHNASVHAAAAAMTLPRDTCIPLRQWTTQQ